jgi:hypothetical protein
MKLLSLLLLVVSPVLAQAEVREALTMQEALKGADKDTLVIFDLDNTVMMPPQTLGGEEWFDYFVKLRIEEFQKNGHSAEQSKDKAIEQGANEWVKFHLNARVVPVEKETPSLINDLQNRGIQTMALTARPTELKDSTASQLKSIGIEFSKKSATDKNIKLSGKHPAEFYKGALLVGPKNNKGELLVAFLKQLSVKPKKIIFVDNKIHHVENVEKALASLNIAYFGRRHAAADQKINSMDKELVKIQHKYFFGEVLSDREAKKLL